MRGIGARVTTCIGGKDDTFAVQIQPLDAHTYFAYKSLRDFDALWRAMQAIVADIKLRKIATTTTTTTYEPSLFAKWMESFVDHYAFDALVQDLRAREQSVIQTLNVFLHVVLRRVSSLYVEATILRCGCCDVARKLALVVRNFLEFAPRSSSNSTKDASKHGVTSPLQRKRQLADIGCDSTSTSNPAQSPKAPLFPTRSGDRSPKARKLSSVSELCIPTTIRKLGLDAPHAPLTAAAAAAVGMLPSRRRVFAEVDF